MEMGLVKEYGNSAGSRGRLWMHGVAAVVFAFIAGTCAGEESSPQAADSSKVEIYIDHAIPLPWGKPGFRISVEHWGADVALSLAAIGPAGERVELVPMDRPLHADEEGNMVIDLGYDTKGLTPGHWMFVVAGEPGFHVIQTDLPRVEAPTKKNPNWRLNFGNAPESGY